MALQQDAGLRQNVVPQGAGPLDEPSAQDGFAGAQNWLADALLLAWAAAHGLGLPLQGGQVPAPVRRYAARSGFPRLDAA